MVTCLFFPSRSSYRRAVDTGGLELFARGLCGVCNFVLGPDGWGKRIRYGLPLRRARCGRCKARFTFLPVFLYPGLWYDQMAVDEVLEFLSRPEFKTAKAAVTAWDHRRTDRMDDGEAAVPSACTAWRWWTRLGSGRRRTDPLAEAVGQVVQRVPDHPLPSQIRPVATVHRRAAQLRFVLVALGQVIAAAVDAATRLPLLALGLWTTERQTRCRCLSRAHGPERVIPGPSPRVKHTADAPMPYRPDLPGP